MKRQILWEPGYDHRNNPEKRNYGCHGMDIRFIVSDDVGAVQFLLYTGWLPTWKSVGEGGHLRDNMGPLPADLGYHSKTPRYEGQEAMPDCPFLGGAPCYYDGSSLQAEEPFKILVSQGEEALWTYLEAHHKALFEEVST